MNRNQSKKKSKKLITNQPLRDNFSILLDNFLSNLMLQYTNYSQFASQELLVPNKNKPDIIYKQYMNYYVYRIICKYLNILKDIVDVNDLKEYLLSLNIEDIQSICVGMRNRMPTSKRKLNNSFNKGINLLRVLTLKKIKYYDYKNGQQFKTFIREKLSPEVVNEDIKNIIKLLPDISE